MRCLVTGGTGFVGRHVVRALRGRGLDVLLYARPTSDTREAVRLGCDIVEGDLQDFVQVKKAVSRAEAVLHVGEIGMRVKDAASKNVELVRAMLEEAANHPGFRRFVQVSSVTVVSPPAENPADEDTPPRLTIRDVYTTYKRNCEEVIVNAGVPATIVRGSTIYGPEAPYLVWFAKWLRRTRYFGLPFPGLLDVTLPCIHVEDLAAALASAALQKSDGPRVYNGCSDEGCSVRDFTSMLGRLMNMRFRLLQVPLWLQRAGAFGLDGLFRLFGLTPNVRSIIDYLSYEGIFRNDRMKQELNIDLKFPTIREGLPGTASWIVQTW